MKPESQGQASFFYGADNSIQEYTLVVLPSEYVNYKVMSEREIFYHNYEKALPVKAKPNISIANFFGRESMEETLFRWIQRVCSRQESFLLTLNNYGGFPPDTIYLRIQDPAPLYSFIKALKIIDDFLLSSLCPPLQSPGRLHLTLATRLPKEVYDKAIKEYAQKDFNESFMAAELVLLKKSHEMDSFKRVNVFAFSPAKQSSYE